MLGRYSTLDYGRGSYLDDSYNVQYSGGHLNNNRGHPSDIDPSYLGIAKENAPWLSRLLFYWVHPLIKKGRMEKLKHTEDLFDVPLSISAPIVSETFQHTKDQIMLQAHQDNSRAMSESATQTTSSGYQVLPGTNDDDDTNHRFPLLKMFVTLYWRPFMVVGLLRFLADCFGFASPMLLNLMVKFVEDKKQDVRLGYLYAFGLLASTISVALCITHFNLLMCELNLKVRQILIYRHLLNKHESHFNGYKLFKAFNFL